MPYWDHGKTEQLLALLAVVYFSHVTKSAPMFINPELVTQAYTENSWGNPLTSNSHGFTDLVTYEPGYFMTPDSEVAGAQENIQAVRMGTHRVPFVFHPNSNGGEWQFSIFRNKMIREKYLLNDSLAPNEFRNPHRAPNFHPQLPNKAAKSGLRAEAKPFKPKQHLDKLNMMPKLSEQMNEAVKKITASHNNYNEPTGEKAPSSMNNEKQLPHYTPPDGVFNAISPPQCASPASSSASSPSSAHHKDWNKNQDRHQEVHNGKLLENVRPIGSEKETGHGHGQIQSENKMRPPSDSLEETGSSKRRESSTGTSNQDPTDNPNAVLTTCQMKSIDVDPTDIHPGSSRLSTRENPDSIQVDSNRKERILASELQSGDVELFSVPRKNIPGIDHTDGSEDLKGKESPEVSQRSPQEVAAASKGINKIQNSRDRVHPDQKVMIRLLESKDKLRQDSLPHQLGTSIPALLDQPLVNHKKYTPEAPKGSPPIHTCSSGSSELTQTTAQVKKLSISNISHMKPHNAVSISKKRNKKGLTLRIPCEKGNKEQRMFEGTSSPKNGQLNDSDIISITKTKIGNPLIDSTQKSTQDLPLQQPGSPQAIQLPTNQQLATGNKIDREQIQTIELDQKVEKAGLEDGKHWGMTGTTPKDSILEIDETKKKNWEKQILKKSHFGKAKNTKPVEPVSKEDGFMLINSQGKNEEISSSNAKEGLGTNFATLEDLKWKTEIPEAEKDSFKEKLHVKRRQKGEGNLPKSSGSNKKTDLNSPRKKLGSKAYQITLEEYFEEVHCRAQKGIRKEEHLDDGQSVSVDYFATFLTSSNIDPKNSPLYRKFQFAFEPGSRIDGYEVFECLKKNPHKISKEIKPFSGEGLDNMIKGQRKMIQNNHIGQDDISGKDILRKWWKKSNLHPDLMEILSRHLKIDQDSKNLPLDDMTLDDYKHLLIHWKRDSNSFLGGLFFSLMFIGTYEGLRRLNTMAKQISEHTIVENWKSIKESLIKLDEIFPQQVEEFEKYYRLSERFPNMLNQELYEPQLKGFDSTLQVKILSSLGIFISKRQNPISNDDLQLIKNSKIWQERNDLHLSSIHNGVNVEKVVSIFKKIDQSNVKKKIICQVDDILKSNSMDSSKETKIVENSISSERRWLRKIYGNSKRI